MPIFILFLISISVNCLATPEGLKLATKVYERPDGKDSVGTGQMILIDKGGQKRERKLTVFRREPKKRVTQSLIRFHSPKSIENLGMLTIDEGGDETQQHLFLPAVKRPRRISSSRKGGRFVNSDFYYQDLRDRTPDKDTHKILGWSKVGKSKCQLLESIPVKESNSVYKKTVACIHPKMLLALKIDFYEKDLKTITKKLVAERIKKIQGYWTVLKTTAMDMESGHKTILSLKKLRYNVNLPASIFLQQNLANRNSEKKYY